MSRWLLLAVLAASPTTYGISGQVRSSETGTAVEGALVVLQCTCLDRNREAVTDAHGRYHFGGLPEGHYKATVLHRCHEFSKEMTLGPPP